MLIDVLQLIVIQCYIIIYNSHIFIFLNCCICIHKTILLTGFFCEISYLNSRFEFFFLIDVIHIQYVDSKGFRLFCKPLFSYLCHMFILAIAMVIFVILYVSIILIAYRWLIHLRPNRDMNESLSEKYFFSIIIPARNEEKNIIGCLSSICANNYSHFEIIVIDDHSTDNTFELVNQYAKIDPRIHVWKMDNLLPKSEQLNAYKKKAISLAIEKASGDYIITTDADCTVGKEWLSSFANKLDHSQAKFIAAPVRFIDNGSFLDKFQCLDFMSLQGITIASVSAGALSMCNGANLCYEKSAFFEVGGFKGVDNLASGDDMFLMFKFVKRFPSSVQYLFSSRAIVDTLPMPTLSDFVNQRIRWASKSSSYDDKRVIAVLLVVFLTDLSLLISPFCFLFATNKTFLLIWLIALVVKTSVEIFFMKPVATFFQQKYLLKWFVLMEPFHIVYTVVLGILGKTKKYKWKGRQVH